MTVQLRTGAGRHVVVVGAGFTGLAAALELSNAGCNVTVIEREPAPGGLAGGFLVNGSILEKFYHHWFTNDTYITDLVAELGARDHLIEHKSRTGMYYSGSLFRLSRPLDVLKFKPLPFIDRIRLALLVLQARAVKDWRPLENISARDWLLGKCGSTVYRVVWEPLMRGKFGAVADDISAVWLWNKLCLRGGSRDKSGNEVLLYYRGGFAALAAALTERLASRGVQMMLSHTVTGLEVSANRVTAVMTSGAPVACDDVIFTTPLPVTAELLRPHIDRAEYDALKRVRFLANVCLILRLDRSLSDLYWINVNDPSFPFVGIIEHTNFEPAESYAGEHIVYLSRYLPQDDPVYHMSDAEYLEYALPYVVRMFPDFRRSWIKHYHTWRADHAQPVVELRYSQIIPPVSTPLDNAYISTMAQVYPEDRGTNYAIRGGREVGKLVASRVPV